MRNNYLDEDYIDIYDDGLAESIDDTSESDYSADNVDVTFHDHEHFGPIDEYSFATWECAICGYGIIGTFECENCTGNWYDAELSVWPSEVEEIDFCNYDIGSSNQGEERCKKRATIPSVDKLKSRIMKFKISEDVLTLGFCYEYGCGANKDLLVALQWYEVAASIGNGFAIRKVNQLLRNL